MNKYIYIYIDLDSIYLSIYLSIYKDHYISFLTFFFVWALLLIVHT